MVRTGFRRVVEPRPKLIAYVAVYAELGQQGQNAMMASISLVALFVMAWQTWSLDAVIGLFRERRTRVRRPPLRPPGAGTRSPARTGTRRRRAGQALRVGRRCR
ncbi:hypothetical protein SBADM41S_10685 [Streptomyces badius]